MKQSFTWWSFSQGVTADQVPGFLNEIAELGIDGVEMLPEKWWPHARNAGLEIVTLTGHKIENGFNNPSEHRNLRAQVERAIDSASQAHIPFVIVFSGNRLGPSSPESDNEAIIACAEGLRPLARSAEDSGVTLILELLNSKVDHPGYQADSSKFGFEIIRQTESPGLKVLFDIYHMQVMEGDVMRTIKSNIGSIAHIHTAGVPGRRDLDDRQELNWNGIASLLNHLDYQGWIGHEFIPRKPVQVALTQAIKCFVGES